ncbi:hypothetical protein [Pseudonocardia adelaidensis]|uniref:Uncharacterized protein n=1 Tax=Pseudonocardia adelaidensis TaxID=648754 RepID=A0ABP9NN90_9PSEU
MDTTAVPVPRVLVIGLDPFRVPGPWDPTPVADAVAVGMARFADAGVEVESCFFGLDGSDDIEAVVTEALERRPWEVVVVGGGVREPEDQLDLFERVINLVHRLAPGAAIAFNSTPSDTFDAAARWLGRPRSAPTKEAPPGSASVRVRPPCGDRGADEEPGTPFWAEQEEDPGQTP